MEKCVGTDWDGIHKDLDCVSHQKHHTMTGPAAHIGPHNLRVPPWSFVSSGPWGSPGNGAHHMRSQSNHGGNNSEMHRELLTHEHTNCGGIMRHEKMTKKLEQNVWSRE